ncbi:MAG: hypothetical protein COA91_13310 [Robiginitomaculum sp.]|nr:MAG: hypothetical protein COA91_13310 [Robiginitomaculum sp.]
MDGFIFFLIFIFVVIPIIKNFFGGSKSSQKTSRSKTNQWGQSHEQIKSQPVNPVPTNRGNGHKQTRFQTHKRTHQRTQDQMMRDKERDSRQRETHKRLASLRSREHGASIVRVGNKSRDDWGVRGDNSGIGGLITIIILGVIIFFVITSFAPFLMEILNDF